MPDPHARSTVLAHPRVPSPDSATEQGLDDVVAVPLAEALRRAWPTDAHVTQYEAVEIPCEGAPGGVLPVRLAQGALEEGVVVRMRWAIADVDPPRHEPTPAWRETTEAHLRSSGLAWYRTRRGYRALAELEEPIEIRTPADAAAWRARYAAWLDEIEAAHGITCDRGCADWQRLFRLPRVVRDGRTEDAPLEGTIGRVRLPEAAASGWVLEAPPEAPPVAREGDVATDAALGAMLGALGSWRDYDGRKHAICGALAGVLRKAGYRREHCAELLRAWLPAGEPGVDVERGIAWALRAWDRPAEDVSGGAALRALVGDQTGTAIEVAASMRRALRREPASVEPYVAAPLAAPDDAIGRRHSFLGEEEPLRYVVEGLRLAPSDGKISVIAGQPGGAKGPIADHIAVSLALGAPVFGTHAVRACGVMLLDCEGARLSMRRMRRMAMAIGRAPSELEERLRVYDTSAVDMLDAGWLDALARTIDREGVETVILDSYTSAMLAQDVEANSTGFALLARALGQLGVLVLAVAHANKSAGRAGGRPRLTDVAYSGAFAAMAQTAIVTWRPDEDDEHRIGVACARAPETAFPAHEIRFRDTRSGGLAVEHAGATEEGPTPGELARAASDVGRYANRIEEALVRLAPAPLSTRALRDAAGVPGRRGPGGESLWHAAIRECVERRRSVREHVRAGRDSVSYVLRIDVPRREDEHVDAWRARLVAALRAGA